MENIPIVKRLISYFLRGLILVAPIFVTILIIVRSLEWLDGLIPIDIPGIGILIIFVSITILGSLTTTFIVKPIFEVLNTVMENVPGVNFIFKSLKDVINAFGGNSKFKTPVLVTIDKNSEIKRIGFITESDLKELNLENQVAVYFPDSYGLTGNLYVVPKESVSILNISSSEAMKFIISGGVTGL
ncbi:MAG: DUF502 domain-containing protein [Bacteroidota bacterium]|nr:DUF502 domain-containing protein [Bacteroidota bacterium]